MGGTFTVRSGKTGMYSVAAFIHTRPRLGNEKSKQKHPGNPLDSLDSDTYKIWILRTTYI